jgi:hypothetical protein
MPGHVCSEEAVRIGAEGMGAPKPRSLLSRSGGAEWLEVVSAWIGWVWVEALLESRREENVVEFVEYEKGSSKVVEKASERS